MGNNTIITKMREIRRKAVLVQHEKLALRSGLVSERKIWKVPRSERYPDGFKYRMVLTDPIAHSTVLLYDNHWPKGPHIHWLGAERPYEFVSLEQLMVDFLRKSAVEEARFYESKKNRD